MNQASAGRLVSFVGRKCGYDPAAYRTAMLSPSQVTDEAWEDAAENWMELWGVLGAIAPALMLVGLALSAVSGSHLPFRYAAAGGAMAMAFGWTATVLAWSRRAYWRAKKGRRPVLFHWWDFAVQTVAMLLVGAWVVVSFT